MLKDRSATLLLIGFLLGSLYFMSRIETVFNGGYAWTFDHLWAPWLAIIFGFAWLNRNALRVRARRPWHPWVLSLVLYWVVLLSSQPYVMAVNAIPPHGGRVEYRGPIVDKFKAGGRHIRYEIRVRDSRTGETVTLNVGGDTYAHLEPGNIYATCFEVGRLGIPFRWRSDSMDPCSKTGETRQAGG